MENTTQLLIGLAIGGALLIALLAIFSARVARRRHLELKQRFGPEYDRAIVDQGSVSRAERTLLAREKRVEKQHLRVLGETDRVQFSADWRNVQARFVDDPSGAVQAADDLINMVMRATGYDSDDFEHRVADLSVEHANVVQHYRAARVLADANREGRADTEELRQAFVHYRSLFADLLEPPQLPEQSLRQARA